MMPNVLARTFRYFTDVVAMAFWQKQKRMFMIGFV